MSFFLVTTITFKEGAVCVNKGMYAVLGEVICCYVCREKAQNTALAPAAGERVYESEKGQQLLLSLKYSA